MTRAIKALALPLVASLLVACTSSDDEGTTAAGTGSSSGHADHAGDPAGDGDGSSSAGESTGAMPPGSTGGGSADDTGPGGTTDAATGSTGAAAMDTWENWALPQFFEVYCNACHPGQSPRDFSVYETVVENAEHIRCGVAPEAIEGCDPGHIEPGHLPIGRGPFPSDEERWRLVDWVLAGMPRD